MRGNEEMESGEHKERGAAVRPAAGLAAWVLERLRRAPRVTPRLALLERITLAPRQSLALVEAEGRRLLVATSPEGAPTFYALDGQPWPKANARSTAASGARRVSW
ncbi:MAG: flagellar biosynthetic protein FliO [Terracidiphilus sp.]